MASVNNIPDSSPARSSSGSRWHSWALVVGLLALLLVMAAAIAAVFFRIDRVIVGDLSLLPGQAASKAVSQNEPTVTVGYLGIPTGIISLQIDKQPQQLHIGWITGYAAAQPGLLSDGQHTVSVQSGDYQESWLFTVDSQAPEVVIEHPEPELKIAKNMLTIQGTTEPNCQFSARTKDSKLKTSSDANGKFSLQIPAHQGLNTVKYRASDTAGNETTGQLEFFCDTTPPTMDLSVSQDDSDLSATPKGSQVTFSSHILTLTVEANDPDTEITQILAIPDQGKAKELQRNEDHPDKIVAPVGGLCEGLHTFSVSATNEVGITTKRSVKFLVDSTERYGEAPLGFGAVGQDVTDFQKRLNQRGLLAESEITGTYDETTRQAVIELQKQLGMDPDGITGPLVYGAMGRRLIVNLSRFEVKLITEDDKLHTYGIATGTAEHPTPTGHFYVADMAVNPTWLPPNSEWAKKAEQAPPGPNNPLGTRWIGIGVDSIGFHGTPYPDSIGTASSHGCMRMRIPDIEDLYERVALGTQVYIFAGDEDDSLLKTYWP